MEELMIVLQVPDFSRLKNRKGYYDPTQTLTHKSLDFSIYPDGEKPENEGYVSIEVEFEMPDYDGCDDVTLLQLTVSVVDSNAELRFPQSFQLEISEIWDDNPISLGRFIRRRALLDSAEEFLPEDKLTLRIEGFYYLKALKAIQALKIEWQRLRQIAEDESWFAHADGCRLLDLRDADSPLCTRLREKSEFFEDLLQMPSKGEDDGLVPIDILEFWDFFNMLCYVRFETLRHIESNVYKYCDLYRMADKYGVVELQHICSEYVKQNLCMEGTIQTSVGLCTDADMAAAAFRQPIQSRWYVRMFCNEGIAESSNWPMRNSLRELKCAAKFLSLEDGDNSVTLCELAARRVLLNRKELQSSAKWSIFAREMPHLTNVISSWNSNQYKQHVMEFDFYT